MKVFFFNTAQIYLFGVYSTCNVVNIVNKKYRYESTNLIDAFCVYSHIYVERYTQNNIFSACFS